MSVTPEFIGQRYKDTNTGNIWIANSTTPGDWALEVQNSKCKWTPVSEDVFGLFYLDSELGEINNALVTFENTVTTMLGGIQISPPANGLTAVSFPNLISIDPTNVAAATFKFFSCPDLISVSAPNLVITGYQIQISSNNSLTTISLDSLVEAGALIFQNNDSLQTLSLPAFVGSTLAFASGIDASGSAQLSNVSIPNLMIPNNQQLVFSSCALTAASVNHILAMAVANPAFVSGVVSLELGTNAAPSGQGIADKATLIGRGVSVTTN